MIEQLTAIITGCFFGIFSGLLPGLHVNTIALIAGNLSAGQDLNIALAIVSMTITHSFVDFIPSILLGIPEGENFLSALPGHRMALKGKALKAIDLSIAGGLFGAIFSFALLPLFAVFCEKTILFLQKSIPTILVASMLLLIISEKTIKKKFFATAIAGLSGTIGILCLQNYSDGTALFALVTGFFGTSTILFSLKEKSKITPQKKQQTKFKGKTIASAAFFGTIASAIVSLFPAIGPSQAAFIVKSFSQKISTEKYLAILGTIGTASSVFSFFTLYLLGKARTGSAVAVGKVLSIGESEIIAISAAIMISTGISVLLARFLSEKVLEKIQKIDYRKTNMIVLATMILLVFFLSGKNGLLLLFVSSATGIGALSLGVKRSNCMAFLIVPTIAYYI